MQNKANWKIDPMNVTNVLTTDYNRKDTWCRGKNKPKTKPFYKNCILSMRYHLMVNMQNEPNGMLFKNKTKPNKGLTTISLLICSFKY
jgi:hypothetical protein